MTASFDGKQKVQKICDEIRKNTLEPALHEAHEIEIHAKKRAEDILLEAERKKEKILADVEQEIAKKQNIFENVLESAKKQVVESIKQHITDALFTDQLQQVIEAISSQEEVVADLIDKLVSHLREQGFQGAISPFIPEKADSEKVAGLVAKKSLKSLEAPISLDSLAGGVQLRLADKGLTLDLSSDTILELIASFVRSEFRGILFKK